MKVNRTMMIQNLEPLMRWFVRALVFLAIFFFASLAYDQFLSFQWQKAYFLPLLIVTCMFIVINTLGAAIWYLLLRGVGEHYPFSSISKIFFTSQIAKYIPGNVAHPIGRMVMATSIGIASDKTSYTLVFELLLLLFASVIFAASTISFADLDIVAPYLPNVIQILQLGLLAFTVAIFLYYLQPNLLSRRGQKNLLSIPEFPSAKILITCLGLYLISYVLMGISAAYVGKEIFDIQFSNVLLVSGIFTIAFVAGFLTPGSPAGIGIREFVLLVLLTPLYGELPAVGIAAFTRIAQILGDGLTFLIGEFYLNRSLKVSPSPDVNRRRDQLHIVYWGTYDLSKPRNPILLNSLAQAGCKVVPCHENIWTSSNDKSQIEGLRSWLSIAGHYLIAYPKLIVRFLRMEKPDFVMLGYMGHLDIFVFWPIAKILRIPIVWDAFISLYSTVVEDRKLFGRNNPVSIMIYGLEWLACRLASVVLLDTHAHANYFRQEYNLEYDRVVHTFVGAEEHFFQRTPETTEPVSVTLKAIRVLFYGTFIPLHGVSTILKASRLVPEAMVNWVIIGKGQEAAKLQAELEVNPVPNLEWIEWVQYEELVGEILASDVGLGIFSDTEKSAVVIPNKAFQIIAAGKPIITRDSPAIRELLDSNDPGVWLVKPEDEVELAEAVIDAFQCQNELRLIDLHAREIERIRPVSIGADLLHALQRINFISS